MSKQCEVREWVRFSDPQGPGIGGWSAVVVENRAVKTKIVKRALNVIIFEGVMSWTSTENCGSYFRKMASFDVRNLSGSSSSEIKPQISEIVAISQ